MIFLAQNYHLRKETSAFDDGIIAFDDGVIAGERMLVMLPNSKEFFFTKGAGYQANATIAKVIYHRKSIDKRMLCFPGFNYANWYYIVADMGFQVYLAKERGIADAVALPRKLVSQGEAFLQFFQLFGLDTYFVDHPRTALKAKQVICFDKFTGRLSEAIKGSVLESEVNGYFKFLRKRFLTSQDGRFQKYPSKKIFSTRRGSDSRVYAKVGDVEREYAAQGYVIVYFGGMDLFEQMAIMENATHFTGFHGANLSNIVFAHQCTHIKELITRELSDDFETKAKFRGMNHSREKLA